MAIKNRQILREVKKLLKNNPSKFAKIEKEFKENTTIAKDISSFALVHYGDFKAIGDYTLFRLGITEKDFKTENIKEID
jgi:hypothetical protein